MLKGCQREMIVLQTRESRFFESAYFILRPKSVPPGKNDMVAEANRIIAAGGSVLREKRQRRGRGWLCFLSGFVSGGGLLLLLWFLL